MHKPHQKNRKDEQRENQRVNRAQRELSQTRGELHALQESWEKEYRNFASARGKFLQLKKVSEKVEQEAESRLGEQLGIPTQLLVVKQELLLFEQNALQESQTTRELKSDFENAQKKLADLRGKIDPKKIEQDSRVKKSRAELEAALKSMRACSNSLDRARIAVERKAGELGQDYQEFLHARQADAKDKNQTKKRKTTQKK